MHELVDHKLSNTNHYYVNYNITYNIRKCTRCGVLLIEKALNYDVEFDWYWDEDREDWGQGVPDCRGIQMKRALG